MLAQWGQQCAHGPGLTGSFPVLRVTCSPHSLYTWQTFLTLCGSGLQVSPKFIKYGVCICAPWDPVALGCFPRREGETALFVLQQESAARERIFVPPRTCTHRPGCVSLWTPRLRGLLSGAHPFPFLLAFNASHWDC